MAGKSSHLHVNIRRGSNAMLWYWAAGVQEAGDLLYEGGCNREPDLGLGREQIDSSKKPRLGIARYLLDSVALKLVALSRRRHRLKSPFQRSNLASFRTRKNAAIDICRQILASR